jgi:DNA-binding NarL/FixJ family response regulator
MIRLVIVDDHALFREGLASILRLETDFEVVGLVGTVQEAVDIVRNMKPDIVLMDYSLPDGTGAEATRRLLAEHHQCKVVFLTMSDKDESLFPAIRSGAKGYLLKNMSPSKLVAAIRAVQRGEGAMSRTMTLRLMEEFSRTKESEHQDHSPLAALTPREMDVLRELINGLTNKEIGESLYISENTVKYYVHSILEKLNLSNRRDAANYAKDHGVKG